MQKLPLSKSSFDTILTMTSDWHVGCGAGRSGDIDRLVQRDKEGLPYIPAKTLTGIWRDACELVALALDEHQSGCWQKWVDYLFGDQPADPNRSTASSELPPRPAALSIRAAYLPNSVRQVLKYKPALRDALTFVKPGISIDAESGCAIKDYLRYEEMVRGGTVLQAKCELNLPQNEEQKRTAYALLVAGSKLVERLGGKRRRGAGKCQLVVEEKIKPWIDWIEAHPKPPYPPNLSEIYHPSTKKNIQIAKDTAWLRIKLIITAESPLIVAVRTVGNVVETLDYIPGTYLLRLISKKLGGLGVDISRAIAQGDLIVTNATVEVDGQPGRHVPLALFQEKLGGGLEKGGKIYNRFIELEPSEQLKGEREGYIGSTNGTHLPEYAKVNLTVKTHNTIQDDVQHPTTDVGGVYSYEAIAAGTKLQAELRLRRVLSDALGKKKKQWWHSLNGENRLGQSKKDDYGAISLIVGEPVSLPETCNITDPKLTVWLLSDVLLRDERLRPTASIEALAKELGQVLGVTVKQGKAEEGKLSLIARQHRIDSWQVRWGLPRPSLVGLTAGTCIMFTVDKLPDSSRIAQVQASGIGERRAEGFGQICFNDPILSAETSKLEANSIQENEQPQNSARQLISESDRAFSYARIVEKAAWREAIRRAVLGIAASSITRKDALGIELMKPTMSQLGALRSVLRRLQQPEVDLEHPGAVTGWLNHLEQTPNRKDKWLPQSLQKIRTLVSSKEQIWLTLNINFENITLTTTGEQELKGESEKESEQLWTEAVQTLVDACIRAHKRDLESQSDTTQIGESNGA